MTKDYNPRIIGLAGPIGSGKSTIAQSVVRAAAYRRIAGHVFSFAGALKAMMVTLLQKTGYSWEAAHALVHDNKRREDSLNVLQGKTMRHALQTLGTEWGRDCIGERFWADLAIEAGRASGAELVVFDDVRFRTELQAIHENRGHVFELVRPGVNYPDRHRSEGEIKGVPPAIDNDRQPYIVAGDILERVI